MKFNFTRLENIVAVLLIVIVPLGCSAPQKNAYSPDSISGKTITLSAGGSSSVTKYGDNTILDIAKAIIPYTYEKTGVETGRIVIRMSLEYSTRDDVEYLLTFESNDSGTIYYTQRDLSGTFTIK